MLFSGPHEASGTGPSSYSIRIILFAAIPLPVSAPQKEPCTGAIYQGGNQVDYGPFDGSERHWANS